MNLPQNYVIEKFFSYCGNPQFKKYRNVYNGSCPICREGKSWLKKRRCFYIVDKNYICCHNCNLTWSPLNWIKKVAGLTFEEIRQEASFYDDDIETIISKHSTPNVPIYTPTLPKDCINLTDPTQLNFFRDNKTIIICNHYLLKRRLLTAANRCKSYYVSLVDYIHKNRLILPFYDSNGKIIFYQSRAILPEDIEFGRYLSKQGAEFSVFGINNINLDLEYIFQFEGPIDSMFVKNGVGIGGLHLTTTQENQLNKYRLHQRIWILDNQLDTKEVKQKYLDLIETDERVFIWPDKFKEFKDLNEICMHYKLDEISPKFFIRNSYKGMAALLKLK